MKAILAWLDGVAWELSTTLLGHGGNDFGAESGAWFLTRLAIGGKPASNSCCVCNLCGTLERFFVQILKETETREMEALITRVDDLATTPTTIFLAFPPQD